MDILRLAFRNLLKRRTRTFLTTFGVLIAIAFTVGLLSISEGIILSANQSASKQKEHILVMPKETSGHPMPMLEAYGTTIPQDIANDLKNIENIKKVYPVFVQTFMGGKKLTDFSALNGITADYLTDLRPYYKLKEGRFLKDDDENAVVIGEVVAKNKELKLGEKYKIKDKELEVVGIFESSGGMLGFEDMIVYVPIKKLQEIFDSKDKVTFFAVTVFDVNRAKETAKTITDKLPDVAGQTPEDILNILSNWIKTARTIHFIIASFALMIGILFVLSTMMMSVSERTKEIGTLRALGASGWFIFRLVLTESLIIGFFAGIIGCILGYGLSRVISFVAVNFLDFEFINPQVTLRILAIGFGTAVLIGAIAGIFPAYKISKTNIVSALKYE